MSVIVKGMEMPKNCKDCPFSDHEAWCLIPGDWRERYYCPHDVVSEFCPLVEVEEPHGDLTDKDKLMQEFMDSDLDYLQRDDWKEVIQIVADADVVIEAEGREE